MPGELWHDMTWHDSIPPYYYGASLWDTMPVTVASQKLGTDMQATTTWRRGEGQCILGIMFYWLTLGLRPKSAVIREVFQYSLLEMCTTVNVYMLIRPKICCLVMVTLVRFEVVTAVTMKNVVFWDIKPQFVLHRRHITSRYTVQPVNAV
jgi:hypothetical protein